MGYAMQKRMILIGFALLLVTVAFVPTASAQDCQMGEQEFPQWTCFARCVWNESVNACVDRYTGCPPWC